MSKVWNLFKIYKGQSNTKHNTGWKKIQESGCYGEERKKQKVKTACINSLKKYRDTEQKRCNARTQHETIN